MRALLLYILYIFCVRALAKCCNRQTKLAKRLWHVREVCSSSGSYFDGSS